MLDPNFRSYLLQGYAKIGTIGYKIALNIKKGKDHIPQQKKLYIQGIRMRTLLKILFRHVTFADDGTPTLWRITEAQANRFITCLVKVGELDDSPIYPGIIPTSKPITLSQGPQGPAGVNGTDGTDANIVVKPKAGELQIKVEESIVAGVKTYDLSFVAYIAELLAASIVGNSLFELGTSQDIDVNLTTTKGTEDIVSLICSNNGTVNADLQPLVNLGTLNGVTQPVTIVLDIDGQTATASFTFDVSDGTTVVQRTVNITFVYPYLYGNTNAVVVNPYTELTKSIDTKKDRGFLLNGTDDYFYIGFPSSYGTIKIYDQNGFEATNAFTVELINVTSTGLTSNWVDVEYRFYRTTLKTDINNATFTIEFQ